MRLDELQQNGVLPVKLNSVVLGSGVRKQIVELSIYQSMDSEFQRVCEKAIVLDDYQWIAINDGETLENAEVVYSGADSFVGVWRKHNVFSKQSLRDNKLVTIRQIKLKKEKKTMDENGINLENMDLGLDNIQAAAPTEPGNVGGQKELSKSAKEIQAIKEKVEQAGIQLADNNEVIKLNQEKGRLVAFICRTDKGIKVAKPKVVRKDANGDPIEKANLDEKQKAALAAAKKDPSKRVPQSCYVQDVHIAFKESKPSAPIAVIVSVPAAGMINLNRLYTDERVEVGTEGDSMVTRILGMDTFNTFLAAAFGGRIKESEAILGTKATWLMQRFTRQIPKKDAESQTVGIRSSIALEDRSVRKTVLTAGNYVPLRRYVTMSQSQIKTDEDAQKLQYNIEAVFKKTDWGGICEADRKLIPKEDGSESAYFKVGGAEPITNIAQFDDPDKMLTDIQIPVRGKKPLKDASKGFSYPYVYVNLADGEGSFKDDPVIGGILNAAGITVADLVKQVSEVTKRSGRSSSKPTISATDYLKALKIKGFKNNEGMDVSQIDQLLHGIKTH